MYRGTAKYRRSRWSSRRQLGADYSTEDGDILLFHDTTRELLYRVAEHASGAFSTFKISGYPANFLNAGQCIFAIDSTAGATWMGTHAPLSDISKDSLVEFETAVRMIPQFNPEHPQMISQGPSVCLFGKENPQEVLASWLFLQYLLTNEVQIPYAQTEGYVPVTSKAQSDEGYLAYLAGGPAGSDGSGKAGSSASDNPDDPLYYEVKLAASKLLLAHTKDISLTAMFCTIGVLSLSLCGLTLEEALSISISAISNVGPALGVFGPTQCWDILPSVAKWICSFLMLIGRLEIFPVVILFTRDFWMKN